MQVSNAKKKLSKKRAALFEALEPRQLFNVIYVDPAHPSIQLAVTSAGPGDQIAIKSGTYQGPTSPITTANLTIKADTGATVVITPNLTSLSNGAIFDVQATGFIFSGANGTGNSLTIDGTSAPANAGVLVEPSVVNVQGATITNVNITHIHASNPGFNEGFGVRVTSGSATMTGGQIDNYQRAGVEVGPALDDSTGNPTTSQTPTGIVSGVKILGPHSVTLHPLFVGASIPTTPSPSAVENGIIFIDGGGGSATGNIVEGNRDSTGDSVGIGAYDAQASVKINGNTVNDNDAGIVVDALDTNEYNYNVNVLGSINPLAPAHGGSKNPQINSDTVTGTAGDDDYVETGIQDGIDLVNGITGAVLTTDVVSQNGDFGLYIANQGMVANTAGANTIQGGNYSKNGIHAAGYSANVFDGSTGTSAKTYGTANTYKTSASTPLVFFASGQFNDIVGNGMHFGFWAGAPATLATNTLSPTTNANNANFNNWNYFYATIGDVPVGG